MRPRMFTDKEFVAAYKKAITVDDICKALSCSRPTAHKHIRRLKLKKLSTVHRSPTKMSRADRLFAAYSGSASLETLAAKEEVSVPTVRQDIMMGAHRFFSGPKAPKDLVVPKAVSEVKLVHALTQQPGLYDDPDTLASLTGVSEQAVLAYLQRVFDHRTVKE